MNYIANSAIYGDGIYELSTAYNNMMGRSTLNYPAIGTPFFSRGGSADIDYAKLGIFGTAGVSGSASETDGFRVVMTP